MNQDNLEEEEKEKLLNNKEENKKDKIDKFITGTNIYTDCLEKIEFNSSKEYYLYYLGINCLDIDKTILKKMVEDYINGIEWCIGYYLDDCPSWTWGYNFIITPLIKDIIINFPKKTEIIYKERSLNPVEQLILAIPPQTYKYVIEKEIIESLKLNKNIGYMIPESYNIDINKEEVLWKCQVRIPIVEFNEYNKEIKKIKIINKKNKIYKFIKNF